MPVLQPMALADYTSRIFQAADAPKVTADLVGQSLVSANLAGHDSHGVIRIMQYLRQIDEDEIRPRATPEVERETPVMSLFNGHRCFGQLAAKVAIENGIDKARGNAVAAVGLKQSGHVGRLGEWVELAAGAGLIALAYANGGRSGGLVAPFGGAERRMGTNPIAVAIPLQDRPALLLDFATSAVAEGKVRVALNSGKPIPEGWVLDRQGRQTRDPADLYNDGMLLPAAGHKGYSLALLADFLGGILTGSGGTEPARHGPGQRRAFRAAQHRRFPPTGGIFCRWSAGRRSDQVHQSCAGLRGGAPARRAGGAFGRGPPGERGPAGRYHLGTDRRGRAKAGRCRHRLSAPRPWPGACGWRRAVFLATDHRHLTLNRAEYAHVTDFHIVMESAQGIGVPAAVWAGPALPHRFRRGGGDQPAGAAVGAGPGQHPHIGDRPFSLSRDGRGLYRGTEERNRGGGHRTVQHPDRRRRHHPSR